MSGRLEEIWVAEDAEAPMRAVEQVEAAAGRGLAGDRYAADRGSWSRPGRTHGQVTLIEAETVEALARDHDVDARGGAHRRNLVTREVALNHLVGREFTVGEVRLRGVKLCEPCAHLERVAGRPLRAPLVHRGGLNCEIVSGGTARVGDAIVTTTGVPAG